MKRLSFKNIAFALVFAVLTAAYFNAGRTTAAVEDVPVVEQVNEQGTPKAVHEYLTDLFARVERQGVTDTGYVLYGTTTVSVYQYVAVVVYGSRDGQVQQAAFTFTLIDGQIVNVD